MFLDLEFYCRLSDKPRDFQYGGYTDDSDLRLVLLHSGFVTLDDMGKAGGRDLRVRLRVGRHARGRYIGGPAEAPKKGAGKREKIKSFAWGNSHDGGSIEVVGIEWVKRGTAHSKHIPNRKARMAQYARQRARLNLAPPPSVSVKNSPVLSRKHSPFLSPLSESDTLVEQDAVEVGKWSLVVGWEEGTGFLYDPDALKEAMFVRAPKEFVPATGDDDGKVVKKRKVSGGDKPSSEVWGLVLENSDEQ